MKKLIFLLLFLAACSVHKTPIQILNQNIKKYIEQTANDPGSYQPVSTAILKYFSIGKYAQHLINNSNKIVDTLKKNLNKLQKLNLSSMPNEKIEQLIKYEEIFITGLEEQDSIQKILQPNLKDSTTLIFVLSDHKFRIKNNYGALVLKDYKIVSDSSMNVLYMGDSAYSFMLKFFYKHLYGENFIHKIGKYFYENRFNPDKNSHLLNK